MVRQREFINRRELFAVPLLLSPIPFMYLLELFGSSIGGILLASLITLGCLILIWHFFIQRHMKKYYKVMTNSGISFLLRKDTYAFPMGNRKDRCFLQYDYVPYKSKHSGAIKNGDLITVDTDEEVLVSQLCTWNPAPGDVFYCACSMDEEANNIIPDRYRSWMLYKILKVY